MDNAPAQGRPQNDPPRRKSSLRERLFVPPERRTARDRALFFVLSPLICAAAVFWSVWCLGRSVTVDGAWVADVASRRELDAAAEQAQARASAVLGRSYELDLTGVESPLAFVRRDGLGSAEDLVEPLFARIDEIETDYVVTVSGAAVGSCGDRGAVDVLLEELKAPYRTANTLTAEFAEPVEVVPTFVPAGETGDLEALRAALSGNKVEAQDYVVEAGDTLSAIAGGYETSVRALCALNPGLDPNTIVAGQTITVAGAVPWLAVRTVDWESYIDRTPFDTQEIPDDGLFVGETDPNTPGQQGWAHYEATVTYINGKETERQVESIDPIVPAVDETVRVGTKARPAAVATGAYQWPVEGRITSYFGRRSIFGSTSFHSGLDIAAPNGSRIRAADGGVVVFAGQGEGINETLGLFVAIDHGDGDRTIYGHCSKLEVRQGQKVHPGQTIARVGSTGRSTGNHLHFMIKRDGVNIDPLKILP